MIEIDPTSTSLLILCNLYLQVVDGRNKCRRGKYETGGEKLKQASAVICRYIERKTTEVESYYMKILFLSINLLSLAYHNSEKNPIVVQTSIYYYALSRVEN
jgi:hypothetical protein